MKRSTTLAMLIAMTIAPITAFAGGYYLESKVKQIQGNVVGSKQAAYDEGLTMINDYRSKSSIELRKEFSSTFDYVDRQSFSVTNTKVTVDEFLQSNGQIAYQPVLSVRYEFRKREIGNR
ncbi:MAG TPA: acyl-CoA synthetase [Vibrio sp.]|nr:acyl-CoA synthetase [Vibrio sp.]